MRHIFILLLWIPFICFADGLKEAISNGDIIETNRGAIPIVLTTPKKNKTTEFWDICIFEKKAVFTRVYSSKFSISGMTALLTRTAITKDISVVTENTLQVRVRDTDLLFSDIFGNKSLLTMDLTIKKNSLNQYVIQDISATIIVSDGKNTDRDIITVLQDDQISLIIDNFYNDTNKNKSFIQNK